MKNSQYEQMHKQRAFQEIEELKLKLKDYQKIIDNLKSVVAEAQRRFN